MNIRKIRLHLWHTQQNIYGKHFVWSTSSSPSIHPYQFLDYGAVGHFTPKQVGVRGPGVNFHPRQQEYPRGEFYPQPKYQIFIKMTHKEWLNMKIS